MSSERTWFDRFFEGWLTCLVTAMMVLATIAVAAVFWKIIDSVL